MTLSAEKLRVKQLFSSGSLVSGFLVSLCAERKPPHWDSVSDGSADPKDSTLRTSLQAE